MSPRTRKPLLLRPSNDGQTAVPHGYERVKLCGVGEAADILGIRIQHFSRVRDELPAPVAELKVGPIWIESDVRALARKRKAAARRRRG